MAFTLIVGQVRIYCLAKEVVLTILFVFINESGLGLQLENL